MKAKLQVCYMGVVELVTAHAHSLFGNSVFWTLKESRLVDILVFL